MRKIPRGLASPATPSSSGVLRSTWNPLASRPFADRRRISASSLSRPGECASSRKMPQQYGSLTRCLSLGSRGARGQRFGQRNVLGSVHVHDGLDHVPLHRLPPLHPPGEVLPQPAEAGRRPDPPHPPHPPVTP